MLEDILHNTQTAWLAVLMPDARIFVVYLLSAFILAILTFCYYRYLANGVKPTGINDKNSLSYIFDKEIFTHDSAKQDYLYFFVNGLVYFGVISQLMVSFHFLFKMFSIFFVYTFGLFEIPVFEPSWSSIIIYTLLSILFYDFAVFITHYLQHKVHFLWEFHKVHHSAEVLNPLTLYRMHPIDLFCSHLLTVLLTSLLFAGYFSLTSTMPSEFKIMNINIFLFAFYFFGYNLRHSHIWINYPVWLSYILVSPAQHHIHHSSARKHWNKNMGLIFSFWDQMFGTLYVPQSYEKLTYGLDEHNPNPFNSIWDMYIQPFKKSWDMLSKHKDIFVQITSCILVGLLFIGVVLGYGLLFY